MNTVNRFTRAAEEYPENIAVEVNDVRYSYRDLLATGLRVGQQISKTGKGDFVGILAYRSLSVYAGIIGSLTAGKCYIPFNPKFPESRILKIIEMTGCTTFIVDKNFISMLPALSEALPGKLTFIFAEEADSFPELPSNERCIRISESGFPGDFQVAETDPDRFVYLLFTSGSTGEPKGIPISHGNLNAYIDFVQAKYPLFCHDRCSQAFDTTFDPSMHDIWVTWNAGATFVVVPELHLLNPVKFIQKKELTVWYSVPSIGLFIKRLRLLKPGIFPLLRYSIFSGEALPADFTQMWQEAAPGSVIINYYGPTEVTINITDYAWNRDSSAGISENNIVPIGTVFNTHRYRVVNDDLHPVTRGETGELFISGIQVCHGYFKNPGKTAENFVSLPGQEGTWYRTGDLVKELPDSCLLFLGRKDSQVKIRGYRVELLEIEGKVKKLVPDCEVKVIAWPVKDNIAEGIICFLAGEKSAGDSAILRNLSESLPSYMIPDKIIYIREFPLNSNGKINSKELINLYCHG